ncbi:OB-fold nucleic acid binding domain-containing protein [Fodinicurvata halophila]|uniref:OB-fold nucleic acid binding domain-containing protein n=1 Tax=Fodinicurvata halophila TaxID=1419723 RepID=UPI003624D5F9
MVAKQERTSKKGSRFAFVQMSDASGVFEVTVFSETLARSRDLLEGGRPLLVTVSVERQAEGDDLRLTAQEFEDLEESLAKTAAGLKVYLEGDAPLQDLRNLLDREAKGRSQVTLVLTLADGREVEIDVPGGFALSVGDARRSSQFRALLSRISDPSLFRRTRRVPLLLFPWFSAITRTI